jgi:hypothetical protein
MATAKRWTTAERWVRRSAFLVGLAVVAVAVLGWRMPDTSGRLGLDLTVVATPGAGVVVAPSGPLLHARAMEAGDPRRRGDLAIVNPGAEPVAVEVGARSVRELERSLRIELVTPGAPVLRVPVGRPRGRWLVLAPGERRDIELSAWLPARGGADYEGHIEDVTLDFRGEPAGSARGGR